MSGSSMRSQPVARWCRLLHSLQYRDDCRFNDRAWSLQVRNRFPTEYKESKELGVGGATGGVPIQIVVNADEANV
jgi:hypothetical protein